LVCSLWENSLSHSNKTVSSIAQGQFWWPVSFYSTLWRTVPGTEALAAPAGDHLAGSTGLPGSRLQKGELLNKADFYLL